MLHIRIKINKIIFSCIDIFYAKERICRKNDFPVIFIDLEVIVYGFVLQLQIIKPESKVAFMSEDTAKNENDRAEVRSMVPAAFLCRAAAPVLSVYCSVSANARISRAVVSCCSSGVIVALPSPLWAP